MPERRGLQAHITWREALPVVLVLAVAVYVDTRFSDLASLTRDEGIYVYSGVRLTHGVAPYDSIWDPKTPGTSFLVALSIELGKLVGASTIGAVRFVFLLTALATAVAVYVLGRLLWSSVLAGLAGAAVFLAFRSWAFEAAAGPDAKMPGILLVVVSMVLLLRRRWFAAGFAAGLAFLFWQPLLVHVAVAIIAAAVVPDVRRRWTAAAAALGAAIPIAATAVYFLAVGSFTTFVDAAFVQPATGAQSSLGFVGAVQHIDYITRRYLGFGTWIFWLGLLGVLVTGVARLVVGRRAALRDPLVCVVLLSALAIVAFSIRDFQNYPDLDPLLPYAALGVGGAVAAVAAHVPGAQLPLAVVGSLAAVALVAATVAMNDEMPLHHKLLPIERAQACALDRITGGGVLYALGSAVPLVLAGRVNPDRFIYFGGGVLNWKLHHGTGSVHDWERQIRADDPATVVSNGWGGTVHDRVEDWLGAHYHAAYVGFWQIYTTSATRRRAHELGIHLTRLPTHPRHHLGRALAFGEACA